MNTEITLRPGVAFHDDVAGAGRFEFTKGPRFDQVFFKGIVRGKTDNGQRALVNVFSAVYPTSAEQLRLRAHLPALAVVPVQTRYLAADGAILDSLFYLPLLVDGEGDIDPTRTMVIPMHGSREGEEDDQMTAGRPCVPSTDPKQWIYLGPVAVAALVEWTRNLDGEAPRAIINFGCFSSTVHPKYGTTFNEELAAVLALQGDIAVYGPPQAGIVYAGASYGEWRNHVYQQIEDGRAARDVEVKLRRIAPKTGHGSTTAPQAASASASGEPEIQGSVVITNHYVLAGALSSVSPDFSKSTPHTIDRRMME